MRQNDPPEYLAVATCRIHPREQSAKFTRQKNLPFQLAACLPEIPPSLLKTPRLDPARQPFPPPPQQLRQRSKGEGAGSRAGPPTHIEQFPISSLCSFCHRGHSHTLQHPMLSFTVGKIQAHWPPPLLRGSEGRPLMFPPLSFADTSLSRRR
jgi:hypothetical protein